VRWRTQQALLTHDRGCVLQELDGGAMRALPHRPSRAEGPKLGAFLDEFQMIQPAFFHQESGSVRFWVLINGLEVGASISKETLHYRYYPRSDDDDALNTYMRNTGEINEAVRRRVAGGSIEPVMLREPDVRASAFGPSNS
jgi:hypothetical protein